MLNLARQSQLALVQGPPGTGKTTTATALVHFQSELHDRVLVAAPTNIALDTLLARCMSANQKSLRRAGFESRLSDKYAAHVKPVTLDAIAEGHISAHYPPEEMRSDAALTAKAKFAAREARDAKNDLRRQRKPPESTCPQAPYLRRCVDRRGCLRSRSGGIPCTATFRQ